MGQSNVILKAVHGNETEVGLGIIVSTPWHVVVAWGEYAEQGEADGEVRVMAAIDADGGDVTLKVAQIIAEAIGYAIEAGKIDV